MTAQLLAEIAGVILAAVFVGTVEARYYEGATGTPYYTIVDAAGSRIGGCVVILPPWFSRMAEFEPYRVGDLVKVTLINGRGYIDGLVQGGTDFDQEAELKVDNSWMELSPVRAVLGHSPNTIRVDGDGISAETDGIPRLLLDNSVEGGRVELRGGAVRLRIDSDKLHLDDPERTDGAIMRALGYIPEWDGNPPPDSGNPPATPAEVLAAEPNTLNLLSHQYYVMPPGEDGDMDFEAGPETEQDGDIDFNSGASSPTRTETASQHTHGMPHTHPVVAHHHTVHDHYHLSQLPFMVLEDKVTIAQDLATQDTIAIGAADIPADMAQMPTPVDLSYQQFDVNNWNLTWNAGGIALVGSSPHYEVEVLGYRFDGASASEVISEGEPSELLPYLLWNRQQAATSFISIGIASQYAGAIASSTFQWTGYSTGIISGKQGLLPMIVGASEWARVDETYAVLLNVTPASIADLGGGVVTAQSQSAIGSISAASVAQVNWSAIRVRSVDVNGNYLPSDWSDMLSAYGVHLNPGYEYRTK